MSILYASAALKFVAFMAALVFLDGNVTNGKASELSARSSSCSLVVVSTLDGKLSALDTRENGELLWTLPAFHGPLLSSSLSSVQMAKHVGVIPSLDGGLYQVNGDKVEPIPFTADTLLGSFYKLPDGSILVGGKEATSCGINPYSGKTLFFGHAKGHDVGMKIVDVLQEAGYQLPLSCLVRLSSEGPNVNKTIWNTVNKVRYVCSADGCQLMETDEGHVQGSDVLVLKRTQQTVRAVDQRTGAERWNFSVGQHDISFLEAILSENDSGRCSVEDEEAFVDWSLRVSIPSGVVAAVHSHGSKQSEVVLWSHQFDSPIAAVWRLSGGFIQPVTLLSKDVMPELADSSSQKTSPQGPVMYIGKHEGQVYIQTSEPFNPAHDMAARIGDVSGNAVVQRNSQQITWKPYLTSSPSRTPTIVTKELAVWNPLEYPYDNGYYFYGEVMPVIPPHTCRKEKTHLPVDSKFTKDENNSSKTTMVHTESSMWWHGTIFLTVATAVVLQLLIHFFRPNKKSCEALMQLQRIPSNTVTTMTSTTSLETLTGPSSPTTPSSLTPTNSFVSRYLTDFEHELCLGKGGFGLVFQAKNKLDDCQYAIKRIRLPNCDEALEKVKREVKALAKLEHPGIVRYYNSWFEAPPVGWQDDLDAKMYEKGTFCGLPSEVPSFGSGIVVNAGSTDNLYDQNGLQQEKADRRRKKTNSSSRSRHSSHNNYSVQDDDCVVDRVNGEMLFDIQQLENDAFLDGHETTDSFNIEFASSSNEKLSFPKNGFHSDIIEDSASHSVVFKHSGSSQSQSQVGLFKHLSLLMAR